MTIIQPKTRNAVCGCSTGSDNTFYGTGRTGYYPTKGHAINAIDGVLNGSAFHISRDDLSESGRFAGDEGREALTICNDAGDDVGQLVCVYYRMNSGRYEFVAYVA